MYIEKVPNRNSPPCVLLRESYRQEGKVHKRTLANLSKLPADLIEGIGQLIKGGRVIEDFEEAFRVVRSLPYGHVQAVLSVLRELGLPALLSEQPCRELQLVLALIVSRIIHPRSKLATARTLSAATGASALGEMLELGPVNETDLYRALDWLLERQESVENALAARHLAEGSLVLYDVSSSYFEGSHCSLARYGYSRDKKRGKLQIVYGLLCNREGCPVAIEVFEGNTADPKTIPHQIEKLRQRFGLKRVILVGDRGMLTSARIQEDLEPAGLDWISALKGPAIRKIVNAPGFDRSLFDQQDLAEMTHPDFPGERLMACFNPLLERKRQIARQELLLTTEKKLAKIQAAIARKTKPLRGAKAIGMAVGQVINQHKVGKHFQVTIGEDSLHWQHNEAAIAAEAQLDGFYIIRTNVAAAEMDSQAVVQAYKQLSLVEQAFRSLKTVDLKIRPIYHYLEGRVRVHVFLCMLAYYVEWHLRQRLAPMLFDDEEIETARQARPSPVAPAQPSARAEQKAITKRSQEDDQPIHSFQTLLDDLATITRNTIEFKGRRFDKITVPTTLQQKALDLLQVKL